MLNFNPDRLSNTQFLSLAAAQAATEVAVGSDIMHILIGTDWVTYYRDAAGVDFIGTDLSAWRRVSITKADLVQIAVDTGNLIEEPIVTSGVFTPGLGFATPGDQVASWGTYRQGRWMRFGNRVSFDVNFNTATITHSTASGRLRVYFTDADITVNALSLTGGNVRLLDPHMTLPSDAIGISVVPYVGEQWAELVINRRDTADEFVTEAHFRNNIAYILQLNFEVEV